MFVNTLKDYKEGQFGPAELSTRMKHVLRGRKDLIQGFNALVLKKKYRISFDEEEEEEEEGEEGKSKHDFMLEEAVSFLNKVKERIKNNDKVHKTFLDLSNLYRKGDTDISVIKDCLVSLCNGHEDLIKELNGFGFISDCESSQNHIPRSSDDCDASADRPHRRSRHAIELNRGRTNCDSNKVIMKVYDQGFRLIEKVQKVIGSDEYMEFLKCLHDYTNGVIERADLQCSFSQLVGDPNLVVEFEDFLEHHEECIKCLARSTSEKSKSLDGDGYTSESEKVVDDEEEEEHKRGTAEGKGYCKNNYMTESLQELDFSRLTRATPSYRLLPEKYRIVSDGRNPEIGDEVLNDLWICVGSTSRGGYSSKQKRINQYEENMSRIEDDKFELDMLFEYVKSALKSAKNMWKQIYKGNPLTDKDQFTMHNIRCIERLYGDYGLDLLDQLYMKPIIVLPIVLIRLKQKKEELKGCREDFDKIWAKAFVKSHKKNEENSSRAEPSKTEIKETGEQIQNEDELGGIAT
ncbi:PAH domain-containing protein/Sin3_corepress domain-containing protein [Cephalotus follicularis]|uniref:PAH domain-containing protein/Sin3_corepress domain-containing protein n=1 Tax=Cephalotus follicularis TaxID=3775 RepID=A0A1Q3BNN3_CEPFO|nr:PAH domain-containing protein/Sin3_corepress domain-containing protein [Cephalotus follicularis]